jgi:hypothetical protein
MSFLMSWLDFFDFWCGCWLLVGLWFVLLLPLDSGLIPENLGTRDCRRDGGKSDIKVSTARYPNHLVSAIWH